MLLHSRAVGCPIHEIPFRGAFGLLWASEESFSAHHWFEPIVHPPEVMSLMHTVSGRAVFGAEGKSYPLDPGSVILFGAGVTYTQTVGDEPWVVRYLIMSGSWATPLADVLDEKKNRASPLGHATRPVAQLLDSIVDLSLNQPRAWEWDCVSRMSELLKQIRFNDRAPGSDTRLVSEVAALIDANPDRAWDINAVARELGIPLSTLTRRFDLESGTPIGRWMRQVRMTRARLLLSQGMSVVAVAEQMKFSSPFHLSRSYKSWAGHSPSAEMRIIPTEMATLLSR